MDYLPAGLLLIVVSSAAFAGPGGPPVLKADSFRHYVDSFNEHDEELYAQHLPNAGAWEFMRENIPLFECPDADIERTYYFRWWTFRKHIKSTPDGFIITEFLPPVPWAGKHNSISCPAAHHFYEGRWLRDQSPMDDYEAFWFRGGASPRTYTYWAADAYYAKYLVDQNAEIMIDLLPDLVENYRGWEAERRNDPQGLFWQYDGNDGGEVSIGGHGLRPTINAAMYGEAKAIAKIARMAGDEELAEHFEADAATLKRLVHELLWDETARFFKTRPDRQAPLVDVREQYGYMPWYFGLPEPGLEDAWAQLMDPEGFYAPFGPTTAEQRHPGFRVAYEGHECQWNGPSWPYATTITLKAMANVLHDYEQDAVTEADYLDVLSVYTRCHQLIREDGTAVPWIDENLNPFTGDWIARTLLHQRNQPPRERGKDYNHSGYADLIITGLVGLKPRADDVVEVDPLLPPGAWDWFCLDEVSYHGRTLAILWDRTGEHYGLGAGLRVLAEGELIASSDRLERVTGQLP